MPRITMSLKYMSEKGYMFNLNVLFLSIKYIKCLKYVYERCIHKNNDYKHNHYNFYSNYDLYKYLSDCGIKYYIYHKIIF